MKLRDAEPGSIVQLVDRMADGDVRYTYYERSPDGPVLFDYNVRVARLRTIQFRPDNSVRYDSGMMRCIDPGEALGAIEVEPVADLATARPPART